MGSNARAGIEVQGRREREKEEEEQHEGEFKQNILSKVKQSGNEGTLEGTTKDSFAAHLGTSQKTVSCGAT